MQNDFVRDGGSLRVPDAEGTIPAIGCTLEEAFALLSGRGVLATNWQPAKKNASQPGARSELEGTETP